jgi:hypothetical protein
MPAVAAVEFITVQVALEVLAAVVQEVYLVEMEALGPQIPAVAVVVLLAFLLEQQTAAMAVLEL